MSGVQSAVQDFFSDSGAVLDAVVVVLAVLYGLGGLRRGFIVSAFSLVGFVAGGALAAAYLPDVLAGWEPAWQRVVMVLGGILVAALVLQAVLGAFGGAVRRLVAWGPVRVVDALLGAVMSVLVLACLVWFAAGALRHGPSETVSRAIASSDVVAALDAAAPVDSEDVFDDLRAAAAAEGFPRVFTQGPDDITPVDPPDGTAVAEVAGQVRGSVVKVTGLAQACARGAEGSGFVVAPQRVVTNAHVVAGMDGPRVQVGGQGDRLDAEVVLFDPERDLAVLAVPGLEAPALALGDDLDRGDEAVVAGFPLDGPYDVEAARVRRVLDALGKDVYGESSVQRHIYSLRTTVQPGNSGGPLLDVDGDVVGVVFARSSEDAATGYALTLDEARPVLEAAAGSSEPVSTGRCVTA